VWLKRQAQGGLAATTNPRALGLAAMSDPIVIFLILLNLSDTSSYSF